MIATTHRRSSTLLLPLSRRPKAQNHTLAMHKYVLHARTQLPNREEKKQQQQKYTQTHTHIFFFGLASPSSRSSSERQRQRWQQVLRAKCDFHYYAPPKRRKTKPIAVWNSTFLLRAPHRRFSLHLTAQRNAAYWRANGPSASPYIISKFYLIFNLNFFFLEKKINRRHWHDIEHKCDRRT